MVGYKKSEARNRASRKYRLTHPGKVANRNKLWYINNADHVKEHKRQYYLDNKEDILRKRKEYRENNHDKIRSCINSWRNNNPEKHLANALKRRSLKKSASGTSNHIQISNRIEMFGGCCWICGLPYEAIDHVKPLSKGGSNWPSNLRPICKSCNSKKKDVWPFGRGLNIFHLKLKTLPDERTCA